MALPKQRGHHGRYGHDHIHKGRYHHPLAGVNAVDPETKNDRGFLQQFVLTAAAGPTATSLAISPAIVTTGAAQNVFVGPADNAAITKVGGAASPSIAVGIVPS